MLHRAPQLLFASVALSSFSFGQQPIVEVSGTPSVGFSGGVSVMGDVDGDSVPDFITRVWSSIVYSNAALRVLSGVDGSVLVEINGTPADPFWGWIESIGDIDGDGVRDILSQSDSAALVHSGATGAWIRTHPFPFVSGGVGCAVSWDWVGAGDVGDADGDGVADYVLANDSVSNTACRAGIVWLLSGVDGSLIRTFSGTVPHERVGSGVAGIEDLDGDGLRDIVIGAYGIGGIPGINAPSGVSHGGFRVYSSGTGAVLYETTQDGARGLGTQVIALGDDNGDGVSELAVGSPNIEPYTVGIGFLGIYDGATGALLLEIQGANPGWYDNKMAYVRDVDGDGGSDVMVQGVVFSGTTGEVLSVFASGENYAPGGGFDWNGDGFDDVAAGGPGNSVGGTFPGIVGIWSLCDSKTTVTCTSNPNSTGSQGRLQVCRVAGTDPALQLKTSDLPPGASGFHVMSAIPGNSPLGTGILCVGTPAHRLFNAPGGSVTTGPDGVARQRFDPDTLPNAFQVAPGETWVFQFVHRDRDVNGQPVVHTSNAVDVLML